MELEKAGDQGRESPMNIHVHAPAVFMPRSDGKQNLATPPLQRMLSDGSAHW